MRAVVTVVCRARETVSTISRPYVPGALGYPRLAFREKAAGPEGGCDTSRPSHTSGIPAEFDGCGDLPCLA